MHYSTIPPYDFQCLLAFMVAETMCNADPSAVHQPSVREGQRYRCIRIAGKSGEAYNASRLCQGGRELEPKENQQERGRKTIRPPEEVIGAVHAPLMA
jgi:hypothetical protein